MTENCRPSLRAVFLGFALCAAFSSLAVAQELGETVAAWETKLDGRVGVILRDTASDWTYSHRSNERFPMASTFKSLLCGAVLGEVDAGRESLTNQVTYSKKDLVYWSPITKKHLASGLPVSALCEAAVTMSDNAAANLLLKRVNGPAGLTGFLRGIGDATTRLDRWEPEMSKGTPKDPRDTTSPRAITTSLHNLLFGGALQPASAALLKQWMIDDQVAGKLIRPHVPDGWIIGDKTGSGGHGTRAIVAFLQTPKGQTFMAAIYITQSKAGKDARNQAISAIGRAMISEIKKHF